MLESRRLLSATLSQGVVTVLGTDSADTIGVTESSTTLTVVDNGVTRNFDRGQVSYLVIKTYRGTDSIVFSSTKVTVPSRIDAGRGNDTLSAGRGSDTLIGGGGDDYLFGGDGNDVLDGESEADLLLGGAGTRDVASYINRSGDVTVGLGSDPDDGEAGEGDNVATDIEVLWGGSGNDHFTTESGRDVRFFGFAGNDTLIGGGGDDVLDGGAGSDFLSGQRGRDILVAFDATADTLSGGSGLDTAQADPIDTLIDIP
jgi:Ca2+-binding RTX toxin-like protein